MVKLNLPGIVTFRGEHLMLVRIAVVGGALSLILLCCVPTSRSEDNVAESKDTTDRTPAANEASAPGEQAQGDKDVIEIPLSEIWALDMPGTRDVQELEPELKAAVARIKTLPPLEMEEQFMQLTETSLIWQIRKSLRPRGKKKPVPGFAVAGSEPELLKTVRDVLTGETKRIDSFSAGSDITVVFFSRSSGSLVQIYHVERRANAIEIQYRIVPHLDLYASEHFALIPLGKLPSAIYQVKIVQGPLEQKYLDAGYKQGTPAQVARFVSQSFKFEVQK